MANMIRLLLSGLSGDKVELNLAQQLHAAGVHLTAIVEPGSSAVTLCQSRGIAHVEYSFRHRFDRRAIALYRELQHQGGFDLIHCLTNRALSVALLATRSMARPPKIVGYRGTMGHLHRWNPVSRLSYLHPRVAAIVCVSGAVRRYLQGFGIPDSRLEVIWKGHDPAWYAPAPRAALAEWGLSPEVTAACFVGNIRRVKGVEYLLQAFDSIGGDENIHLLLIGEVRDARIARRIGRQANVHFLGYRPDAVQLAGACDLAVMPSIEREGLPKAMLEAMAQGVPPVVTAVGGMPELVEDGLCGLVVPPRDPAALRNAIRTLAQDAGLRQRLGAAARARIAGPFHFRHTVAKTLALYERLLGPAAGAATP